jgi:hypothetical protein
MNDMFDKRPCAMCAKMREKARALLALISGKNTATTVYTLGKPEKGDTITGKLTRLEEWVDEVVSRRREK